MGRERGSLEVFDERSTSIFSDDLPVALGFVGVEDGFDG